MPASTAAQWPGADGTVQYSEGILVGYRWYATKGITPLFPFGYGLSYTTFAFSHLAVAARPAAGTTVSADVTNTGARAGGRGGPALRRPTRPRPASRAEQLKGFQRVTLRPGQTDPGDASLCTADAFAWWNRALGRSRRGATP